MPKKQMLYIKKLFVLMATSGAIGGFGLSIFDKAFIVSFILFLPFLFLSFGIVLARLNLTGEIPSEQTIYRYLNGTRELKVELIPYIAEVLGVSEQELFSSEIEYGSDYNYRHSKEVREVLNLLRYLPKPAFEKLKERLLEYKKVYEKGFE